MQGFWKGYDIITTNVITKTVQARKHKKRRINKKWLKRYGYKEVPDDNTIFQHGNVLYMTQKAYKKLMKVVLKEVKSCDDERKDCALCGAGIECKSDSQTSSRLEL